MEEVNYKMYYVYEWFIKETGEVIYVGKGTHNRYKVRKHNRFFNDMIKRFDCDSRIVKEFDDEKDAFEFEYDRVNELWSIGQCVCNINKGGAGGTTSWWDDERKKWYSEHNAMKSESQRKRMSESNPMKNKKVSEHVNSQKRRPVIIGGKEYESVKAAKDEYGVAYQTIKKWCEKGINQNGELCRYKDSEQVVFEGKRYNKGGCKPILYKNKTYESAKDLALEIGKDIGTITTWSKRGFDPDGNVCRYVSDNADHVFEKVKDGEKLKKPIWVNGILYPSKRDAEKQLGLSKGYLAPYIAGTRKNKKYICVYDNQQPSQMKSDNSNLEGSETNE